MAGSRRDFVKTAVMGMGSVALGGLRCAGRDHRSDAAALSDVAQAGSDGEAPSMVDAGAEAGVRRRPADPYQLDNLVGQSAHAETEGQLDARLSAKLAGIDDPFLPGDWYIRKWGYTVDASGTVPYTG
jgi:hypothetical protein